MCDTCGCSDTNSVRITKPGQHSHEHQHEENHNHEHGHSHDHSHSHTKTIEVEQDALSQNKQMAERNRGFLEAKGIFALNLVSSPGSGKTSLLEKTIHDLKDKLPFYVIEGDQQSMNDANRIDATGAPVIQINTGNGCHLDAQMVRNAILELQPKENSLLMIENVGNLVCPALFDLGENKRIVIISVTEGDDKPLKYPGMFSSSDLCIINKTDLLPYVDFDVEKTKEFARRVQPDIEFIETSAKTGDGMDTWYKWLQKNVKHPQQAE